MQNADDLYNAIIQFMEVVFVQELKYAHLSFTAE